MPDNFIQSQKTINDVSFLGLWQNRRSNCNFRTFISYEDDVKDCRDKEREANKFARDFFIDPEEYKEFTANNVFTSAAIRNFAAQQRVTTAIVIGRLQHDGYLGYEEGNFLK